jgi:hypothetical protein
MKQILIGSRATKHWFPEFREPKDFDYLIDAEPPYPKDRTYEFHDGRQGAGMQWILDNSDEIASPEILYTLKLSHCFWQHFWQKTMHDIKFFQSKNIKHNEELFNLLYKDWENIHGKKRAYLNKTNEEFFTEKVDRKYVHDDIHHAIAYYDKPMFEKLKHNKSKAMIAKDLFEDISHEDKCRLCREEIYVTALERFIIPADFRFSKLTAYMGACKLLLTSMTKGYFPKFIAMNWLELSTPDDHNFVDMFKQNLPSIRLIERKTNAD